MLPDFPLLPHELPPDSSVELVAPADAVISTEKGEVLMRVVRLEKERYLIFLRFEERNFVVVKSPWLKSEPMIWLYRPNAQKLKRIFQKVVCSIGFRPDWLCRLVFVGDEENRVAFLGSARNAWLNADLSYLTHFSFFTTKTNQEEIASFLEELKNENSYPNDAWRVSQMSEAERSAHAKIRTAGYQAERQKEREERSLKNQLSRAADSLFSKLFRKQK